MAPTTQVGSSGPSTEPKEGKRSSKGESVFRGQVMVTPYGRRSRVRVFLRLHEHRGTFRKERYGRLVNREPILYVNVHLPSR